MSDALASSRVYSPEIEEELLKRMAEGESRTQICRDAHMPSRKTINSWLLKDEDFAKRYAVAQQLLFERWADEMLEIADDSSNDYIDRETKAGRMERRLDRENIYRSDLRFRARQWLLAKLCRHTFGDRMDLTHGNPDGTPLSVTVVN